MSNNAKQKIIKYKKLNIKIKYIEMCHQDIVQTRQLAIFNYVTIFNVLFCA